LCKEDQFIIIASDGLWDVMSSEEVVDFLHQLRHINPGLNTAFLAQALVYEASSRHSTDNITVLVVEFENEKANNNNIKVEEVQEPAQPEQSKE